MEREKKNSSLWTVLALALLLCFGIFIASTGTAFGRYKSSDKGTIVFEMDKPAEIYVGKVSVEDEDENEYFSEKATPEWISEGSKSILEFAVSNGTLADEEIMQAAKFSEEDLIVKIRLISDLGLTAGTEKTDSEEVIPVAAKVTMTVTEMGKDGTSVTKTAFAERIIKDSTLFFKNGDGWIYSFPDDEGKEAGFELAGGKISYIKVKIEVDLSGISAEALSIEPQIIVERAK